MKLWETGNEEVGFSGSNGSGVFMRIRFVQNGLFRQLIQTPSALNSSPGYDAAPRVFCYERLGLGCAHSQGGLVA
jgi:hypothetical protein